MKAITLSAGQGSRLLPLTEDRPKCLLPVGSSTLLEHQVHALHRAGIEEIVVVTGFCAGAVEACAARLRRSGIAVRTAFNPFFNVADNLASCWMVRQEMDGDFVLVNGDTLFEPAVCERLLAAPPAPVTLAVDHKQGYDSDDMKVRLQGTRLLEVGKTLQGEVIDGESIGMLRFQGDGPKLFAELLEQMLRSTPNSLNWWYLKAIDVLADRARVQACSIQGLDWAEVDFPHDLDAVQALFREPAAVRGVSG